MNDNLETSGTVPDIPRWMAICAKLSVEFVATMIVSGLVYTIWVIVR